MTVGLEALETKSLGTLASVSLIITALLLNVSLLYGIISLIFIYVYYIGKKMDTAICFSVFSVININMIFFIVLGTFKLPISPYLTDSSMGEGENRWR